MNRILQHMLPATESDPVTHLLAMTYRKRRRYYLVAIVCLVALPIPKWTTHNSEAYQIAMWGLIGLVACMLWPALRFERRLRSRLFMDHLLMTPVASQDFARAFMRVALFTATIACAIHIAWLSHVGILRFLLKNPTGQRQTFVILLHLLVFAATSSAYWTLLASKTRFAVFVVIAIAGFALIYLAPSLSPHRIDFRIVLAIYAAGLFFPGLEAYTHCRRSFLTPL